MEEITHCHNQRPIYELENRNIYSWNTPQAVRGKVNKPDFPIYHPVIIDIETSAELGQRPILLVIYDSLAKDLILLYTHGYQEYTIKKETLKHIADKIGIDQKRIVIDNLSQSKFEYYVLRRIHEWNTKASKKRDRNRKSLVAHNAVFDIPMLGSPDDGLLDLPQIGSQYEMAVHYKHVKMIGHRAGQFGQIFQFLDSNDSYNPLYIPVGDTMVTAQALWLPGKLSSACDKIDVPLSVTEAEEHGNLSDKYVEYCVNDVWATYLLYEKLSERLQSMFGNLPVEHIYSTASIGKFVLRSMGYRRVGYEQEAVDRIAQSYFGGRTDAEITGEIVKNVRYTDILSQYPTVSKLTNVWDFTQCDYVTIEQIEPDDLPDVQDLRNSESWKDIANYYVKINPKGATLPIRTPHLDDTTKVVTSKVFSQHDIHYHYMDIIAAELIDNDKKFDIVSAWKVIKHGKQQLKSFEIAGVTIRKYDNVMAKSIEARKNIQLLQGFKDEKTLSLKIVANALYGCNAERIVKEKRGEKHDFASKTGFYNPHVAATITAGGRLMLALGEHLANKYDGQMVYCDTDSLILSDDITDNVIADFNNLNPYNGKAGTLQMLEDEKGEIGNLYAVGTKKYIFFNDNGKILEYKEHGIANYENLRDKETIQRFWATILYYDTGENPLNVPILYDGTLNDAVLWSFTASTQHMRILVNDMTDDYVRYGDWLQSTISYDNSIRYMALNLTEKAGNDTILKVVTNEEKPIEATTVTYKDMLLDKRIKTVRDVVMKFVEDSATPDIRPTVMVNALKVVTKEATNRQDIFETNLAYQFEKNLIHISTILDTDLSVEAD